jgi:hypothetical protein
MSVKDAKLAQKLGETSVFSSCIPAGMHGPTCIFWANLTPFSLAAIWGIMLFFMGQCGYQVDEGGAGITPQPILGYMANPYMYACGTVDDSLSMTVPPPSTTRLRVTRTPRNELVASDGTRQNTTRPGGPRHTRSYIVHTAALLK